MSDGQSKPRLSLSGCSTISLVIPSCGEARRLLACLGALARQSGIDEIVVAAHGESPSTAAEVQTRHPHVLWVECPRACRGDQLNRGASAARGDILLFLHADTELPADAAEEIRDALEDPEIVGGAFRLGFDAHHPVLSLLSALSVLRWRGTFLGDQAMFCRRTAFARVGAFRDEPLFEDVDLAHALAREGRLVRLQGRVTTSARRFLSAGPARQLARNAALLALHRLGMPGKFLAPRYSPPAREIHHERPSESIEYAE